MHQIPAPKCRVMQLLPDQPSRASALWSPFLSIWSNNRFSVWRSTVSSNVVQSKVTSHNEQMPQHAETLARYNRGTADTAILIHCCMCKSLCQFPRDAYDLWQTGHHDVNADQNVKSACQLCRMLSKFSPKNRAGPKAPADPNNLSQGQDMSSSHLRPSFSHKLRKIEAAVLVYCGGASLQITLFFLPRNKSWESQESISSRGLQPSAHVIKAPSIMVHICYVEQVVSYCASAGSGS